MKIKKQMSELKNKNFVVRGLDQRDEEILTKWLNGNDNIFADDLKWGCVETKMGNMYAIKCINEKHPAENDVRLTRLAVLDFLTDVIDCEIAPIPQNWDQMPASFKVLDHNGNEAEWNPDFDEFYYDNGKVYNGGSPIPNEIAYMIIDKIKAEQLIIQEIIEEPQPPLSLLPS